MEFLGVLSSFFFFYILFFFFLGGRYMIIYQLPEDIIPIYLLDIIIQEPYDTSRDRVNFVKQVHIYIQEVPSRKVHEPSIN